MVQLFDSYGRYEIPPVILCNPNKEQISELTIQNSNITLRYNDVSDLKFDAYSLYSNEDGTVNEFDYFNLIQTKRLVYVKNLGYFIISEVEENDDGINCYKSVVARSAQFGMAEKNIDYLNGTYKFYDPVGNYDEHGEPTTMIGYILKKALGWTIGSIDSDLYNKYRTVNINNRGLLDFIYTDVEEAYQCIFEFDFLNYTISVRSVDNLLKSPYKTDIYISHENLMKNLNLVEQADEIKTKLYVYGQDLDIRSVNPTGTPYIIDLNYYMTNEWMPQALIDKITLWQNKVKAQMNMDDPNSYGNLLVDLHGEQNTMATYSSDLTHLQGELKDLENLMSVRISGGQEYGEILTQINAKKTQINNKISQINTQSQVIGNLNNMLIAINNEVKIENNFTLSEIELMDKFLYEDTYSNNNFIITDNMTANDIQTYAMELYDEGVNALARISQPRYTFNIDSANFIFIKDFQTFTNQLEVGRVVNVEGKNEELYAPVLLEIEYSWHDIDTFNLTFGNRFRLSDSGYTYSELIGEATNTSGKVSNNWEQIIDFSKNYKSEINDLIRNAFDVALREIISSSNQDIVWNSAGMHFRKYNPDTDSFDDEQIKIINNKIVFTDDSWNTLKTVIGKIALDSGGSAYGVAAEVIIGKLLAGENLTISNASNTFVIDENGFSFIVPNSSGGSDTVSLDDYIDQTLDGKVNYFWQSELPHPEYSNVVSNSNYDLWVGDTWYYTTNDKTYTYTKKEVASGKYDYTWVEIAIDIPQELYDKIDGKKSVYTKRPTSFNVNDIWVYEGAYNASSNPTSDLVNSASPSSGFYQAPYIQGTSYTYFAKDDFLVATADSTTYDPSKWRKYNTNVTKSGSNFAFVMNNDGVSITNGNLSMTRGSWSKILLDPTNGIKIQKNNGSVASPIWQDQFYADENGNLILSANITATSGNIGGWNINSNYLLNGATSSYTVGMSSSITAGDVAFWAGSTYANRASAPFRVTNNGNVYATSGTFTGIINATSGNISGKMTFGDSNFYIDGSSNASYRLYMHGSGNYSFSVDRYGSIYANGMRSNSMGTNRVTIFPDETSMYALGMLYKAEDLQGLTLASHSGNDLHLRSAYSLTLKSSINTVIGCGSNGSIGIGSDSGYYKSILIGSGASTSSVYLEGVVYINGVIVS